MTLKTRLDKLEARQTKKRNAVVFFEDGQYYRIGFNGFRELREPITEAEFSALEAEGDVILVNYAPAIVDYRSGLTDDSTAAPGSIPLRVVGNAT